jgi:hypothetical protein
MRTASRALGGCALRRYLSEERHLRRVFDGAYTTCALLYCAARSARFARCIALAASSSISPARRRRWAMRQRRQWRVNGGAGGSVSKQAEAA